MMIRSAKFKLSIYFSILLALSFAQSGYDIRFNMKGNKDTVMYLVKYVWDQQYIADTSNAYKAGLRNSDIILSVDSTPTRFFDEFEAIMLGKSAASH